MTPFTLDEVREALAEQLLLQYGTEPNNLDAAIANLLRLKKERLELIEELKGDE